MGLSNPKLFVPKMSVHPGTFDTTGPLFNPKADNQTLDAIRISSLRGARYLAPYGHDGRTTSLREFVRNVIVDEFAGAEPSPVILDALVAYINDIDFLPNPSLGPGGQLVGKISDAERRGEALFAEAISEPTVDELRELPYSVGRICGPSTTRCWIRGTLQDADIEKCGLQRSIFS